MKAAAVRQEGKLKTKRWQGGNNSRQKCTVWTQVAGDSQPVTIICSQNNTIHVSTFYVNQGSIIHHTQKIFSKQTIYSHRQYALHFGQVLGVDLEKQTLYPHCNAQWDTKQTLYPHCQCALHYGLVWRLIWKTNTIPPLPMCTADLRVPRVSGDSLSALCFS